jgi:hypothetical protein
MSLNTKRKSTYGIVCGVNVYVLVRAGCTCDSTTYEKTGGYRVTSALSSFRITVSKIIFGVTVHLSFI